MAYGNFFGFNGCSYSSCPPCGYATEIPCSPHYAYPYSWDYGQYQQQCVGLPCCDTSSCCVNQQPIGVPITPLMCTSIHYELPQPPTVVYPVQVEQPAPLVCPAPVPQPALVRPAPVPQPRLTINPLKLELDKAWSKFKSKYRPFSLMDAETERKRKHLFKRNYLDIKAHNEKYYRGESTYKMGINSFSDWVSRLQF